MYLEADIKVIKMYRKGEMRRKKCKERERRGGGEWDVSHKQKIFLVLC